jgi:DNA-binding transcriptional ArsR family regulator
VDVDVAVVAQLFADRTRAAVVAALIDGRSLTAGELGRAAEVSAPTVSAHLSRLLAAGLVAVETQGRHRYYRLADERAARAFEALAALAPVRPVRSLGQSRVTAELAWARTCYTTWPEPWPYPWPTPSSSDKCSPRPTAATSSVRKATSSKGSAYSYSGRMHRWPYANGR